MISFSFPFSLCFPIKHQICVFYSFCLMLHSPLWYVFLFFFLWFSSCTYTNLPKKPNSNLGPFDWFHLFSYPLPFISSQGGLMWMDVLAYACLEQKFLFILTSFSNLMLALTLQYSWKFKINYVQREVALFFLLCCLWQFWIENFSTGSSYLCFSPSALFNFLPLTKITL